MKEVLLEREFLNTLMEVSYAKDKSHMSTLINMASQLSRQLPKYSQWPYNPEHFWNAEAQCWRARVERDTREFIRKELSFLNGKNLDLGSGSYSYVNSVAADFSEEMLLLNESKEKVLLDLENGLPFDSESFASITLVFVASYIKNLSALFNECNSILNMGGKLVVVQSLSGVSSLHKMHYKNNYAEPEFRILLKKHRFEVSSYTRSFHNHKFLVIIGQK